MATSTAISWFRIRHGEHPLFTLTQSEFSIPAHAVSGSTCASRGLLCLLLRHFSTWAVPPMLSISGLKRRVSKSRGIGTLCVSGSVHARPQFPGKTKKNELCASSFPRPTAYSCCKFHSSPTLRQSRRMRSTNCAALNSCNE